MRDYKKLDIWNRSYDFVLKIYKLTNDFPAEEKYSLVSQLKRASVSITANIAEGSAKISKADFNRFLEMSLGSLFEIENYIMLSKDLGYIKENIDLLKEIDELRRMIYSYSSKVKQSAS